MRPADEQYAVLQKALDRYRKLAAAGDPPTVPEGAALKPGDHAPAARLGAVRRRLAREGVLSDSVAAQAGGAYDARLAGAVAQFQALHGIVADSVLGEETVRSLNVPAAYRAGQIAANLERDRWLPRTLGSRYIVVNVPAFRLEAYDAGRKALEMKVIVGEEYEDKKTPVFSDSMQYVVFRPYWLVTPTIAEKEIFPKAQADPGYMAANHLETYEDHGVTRVRQKPGEDNSLGLIKFMFPNDFNIYLHDTPEDRLFQQDVRALSHGCIRVEHPAELGNFVLGWPVERVKEQMEQGEDDHRVNLPKKVPVYITYFTSYGRDGHLYFASDLYRRDDALIHQMGPGALPDPQVLRVLDSLRRFVAS
jgi:murein L,D-transpeptidase YcbB/YkuD